MEITYLMVSGNLKITSLFKMKSSIVFSLIDGFMLQVRTESN